MLCLPAYINIGIHHGLPHRPRRRLVVVIAVSIYRVTLCKRLLVQCMPTVGAHERMRQPRMLGLTKPFHLQTHPSLYRGTLKVVVGEGQCVKGRHLVLQFHSQIAVRSAHHDGTIGLVCLAVEVGYFGSDAETVDALVRFAHRAIWCQHELKVECALVACRQPSRCHHLAFRHVVGIPPPAPPGAHFLALHCVFHLPPRQWHASV